MHELEARPARSSPLIGSDSPRRESRAGLGMDEQDSSRSGACARPPGQSSILRKTASSRVHGPARRGSSQLISASYSVADDSLNHKRESERGVVVDLACEMDTPDFGFQGLGGFCANSTLGRSICAKPHLHKFRRRFAAESSPYLEGGSSGHLPWAAYDGDRRLNSRGRLLIEPLAVSWTGRRLDRVGLQTCGLPRFLFLRKIPH
jgi:hypothetical protein